MICLSDRWRLGGLSPLSASPAVGVVGGGCAAPVGLLPAGSRSPSSGQSSHLQGATQPETGCPADPGGPECPPTGTAIKIHYMGKGTGTPLVLFFHDVVFVEGNLNATA